MAPHAPQPVSHTRPLALLGFALFTAVGAPDAPEAPEAPPRVAAVDTAIVIETAMPVYLEDDMDGAWYRMAPDDGWTETSLRS